MKNSFTRVPDPDARSYFNERSWSPAINLQHPPLGTSHLILSDSILRVLLNLRTSSITTVMAFGSATLALLNRMVVLMSTGRKVDVTIMMGTTNASRNSEAEECRWEAMLACLLTAVWQKIQCAVLSVCTLPKIAKTQQASARRHNGRVIRWKNIICSLARRNAGRLIL